MSSVGASSAVRPASAAAIPAAHHHLPPPLHGFHFAKHLCSALSHDTFLAYRKAENRTAQHDRDDGDESSNSQGSNSADSDDGARAFVVRVYALAYLRRDEECRFALERATLAGRVVSHPRLLTVTDAFASATDLFMVEPYCSGGDLYEYMVATAQSTATATAAEAAAAAGVGDGSRSSVSSNGSGGSARLAAVKGLPLALARRLARELCTAVHHLHRVCGLVHRNIKLETIFLDDALRLHLSGFGLCAVLPTPDEDSKHTSRGAVPADTAASVSPKGEAPALLQLCCGSKHYAAPELVHGHPYLGEAVDAWACGVVVFALLTGCFPFDSTESDAALYKLVCGDVAAHLSTHPALAAVEDPQAVDLIRNLLRSNPAARFSVGEALEHPFLALTTDAE